MTSHNYRHQHHHHHHHQQQHHFTHQHHEQIVTSATATAAASPAAVNSQHLQAKPLKTDSHTHSHNNVHRGTRRMRAFAFHPIHTHTSQLASNDKSRKRAQIVTALKGAIKKNNVRTLVIRLCVCGGSVRFRCHISISRQHNPEHQQQQQHVLKRACFFVRFNKILRTNRAPLNV